MSVRLKVLDAIREELRGMMYKNIKAILKVLMVTSVLPKTLSISTVLVCELTIN